MDTQKKRWAIVSPIFIVGGIVYYYFLREPTGLTLFVGLGLSVTLKLTRKVIFDTSQRVVISKKSIFTSVETFSFDDFESYSVTRTKDGISNLTTASDFEMIFEVIK